MRSNAVFEGFKHVQVQTTDPEVKINLRYGGNGPPILLIHGNPLTHVHWHLVAPICAVTATAVSRVVCPTTAIIRSGAWARTRST